VSRTPTSLTPLLRGDLYRALALAFDYPSTETSATLEALLADLRAVGTVGGVEVPAPLLALARAWSSRSAPELQARFHRLFDTEGSLGYCESAWRHLDRGAILRDVTGFYRAFGFAVPDAEGQPDSIRHELAFMSYLAYKEWFALEQGWAERAAVTRDAEAEFLADHLGLWVETFAARLSDAGSGTEYAHIGELLGAWIAAECRHFDVPLGSAPVAFPTAPVDPLQGGCPATEGSAS